MKLSDRDIAVRLLALEDYQQGTDQAIGLTVEYFDSLIDDGMQAEHSGDCTDDPWACARCVYENAMARAKAARGLFGIEEVEA